MSTGIKTGLMEEASRIQVLSMAHSLVMRTAANLPPAKDAELISRIRRVYSQLVRIVEVEDRSSQETQPEEDQFSVPPGGF